MINKAEPSFKVALRAYLKVCNQKKVFHNQPSEFYSEIGHKYVYLRNGSNLIAKFNFRTGEIEA